jgi:hypothetical protein
MGRKRAWSPDSFAEVFCDRRDQLERRRIEMVLQRYDEKTAKQYASDIAYIKTCAEECGDDPLDQAWFADFLTLQMERCSAEVGGRIKAAYKIWLQTNRIEIDLPLWKLLGWAVEGHRKKTNEGKPVRGAITFDKLLQLCEVCARAGASPYISGFLVVYCACLRHCQISSMIAGDVSFPPGPHARILCRIGNKGKLANNTNRTHTAFGGQKLLREVVKGKAQKERLFPFWDHDFARWLVREAAKSFEWHPGYIWDGVHNVRYGARQDLANDIEESMRREMAKGAWQSWSACVWYARL